MSEHDSTTTLTSVASEETTSRLPKRKPLSKKRRKPKKEEAETTVVPLVLNEDDDWESEVDQNPVIQYLYRCWKEHVATGYGISFLIHLLLLIIMSFIVYGGLDEGDEMIQASLSEDEVATVFDEISDVQVELPSGEVSLEKNLSSSMEFDRSNLLDNPIVSGVEDSVESLFQKNGDNGLEGGGFSAPPSSRVFRKGSFSAWTVPNDPDPGEDYVIFIVLKLPHRVKKYRASDLEGIVKGTDGYKQKIPNSALLRGKVYLPIKDHQVQVKVKVPGGADRVRDVINIRSTMLKEKQKIELVF